VAAAWALPVPHQTREALSYRDGLAMLSLEYLRLCTSTLGQFGRQADTNIALTAAESLFWGVSDVIRATWREVGHELVYSALWVHLLLEIL